MVTTGKRYTPKEIERSIDSITPADIQRVAKTYLWDKDVAIAALGRVEGLLDYSRIRAGTCSLFVLVLSAARERRLMGDVIWWWGTDMSSMVY